MTTSQANPNLALIKCTLAKLGRTDRKVHFGGAIPGWHSFFSAN